MRRISIYLREEIFLFKILLKKIDKIQEIIISNIIKFLVIKISKNYRVIRRLWIEQFQFKHFYSFYYFNARWNDPRLGRFITENPIKDGNNWYAYVGNDPINFIDPNGLKLTFAQGSSDEFKSDVNDMLGYLGDSDETRDLIIDTHANPQEVQIKESNGRNYYDSKNDIIHINPIAGMFIVDGENEGKVQSPAMGLIHEIDHANKDIKDPEQFRKDDNTYDPVYDTKKKEEL